MERLLTRRLVERLAVPVIMGCLAMLRVYYFGLRDGVGLTNPIDGCVDIGRLRFALGTTVEGEDGNKSNTYKKHHTKI